MNLEVGPWSVTNLEQFIEQGRLPRDNIMDLHPSSASIAYATI